MKKILVVLLLAIAAQAQAPSHGEVVAWGVPSDATPQSIYKIYRASGPCSTATAFAVVGQVTAAFQYSENRPAATTDCYYITQTQNGFESLPSNKAQGTTPNDPNPPSGVTVTPK
jgi:hypothetical protein